MGVGDLAALERGDGPLRGPWYYPMLVGGIVATLLATVLLGRRARAVLAEAED